MSRSEGKKTPNPATIFLKWNGSTGGFDYFDKAKGEKGEKVHVGLPFTFMVLDKLATIKGFSDKEQSGFWSNEVRSTKTDTLTVRTKSGVKATGLYADVMADKNCSGAKFCQSVYVACKIDGKFVMANIQMMGSALSSWIDFGKENNVNKGAITIAKMTEGKKGVTKYKIPVYQSVEADEEAEQAAIEMDRDVLKPYLTAYFNEKAHEVVETKQESPE